MLWHKYKHIIFSFAIATIFSFILVYLGSINFFSGPPVSEATSSNGTGKVVEDNTMVVIQEKYTLCGHLVSADYANDLKLSGLGQEAVEARFSDKKGWNVDWQKTNMLIISRQIEGYCPEDAPKRHLADLNGFVAVYRGPSSSDKMIERVTDIKVENLSEEWREKIKRDELEFGSEKEMLEALDSFDEFSK